MNRRYLLFGLLAAILVAAGAYWYLGRDDAERETAVATVGAIDVTIQTVGTIQATEATPANAEVAGVIERMGVEAGDSIDAGEVVAVLDREPFEHAVAEAEERVAEAEYGVQFAEQRAGENPDDVALRAGVLEAAERVQEARSALATAREALADSLVLAPASGKVIEVHLRAGDGVAQRQAIARIATDEDLRLIADIDELDLPNVATGAPVRFRLDAFPATEIEGRVVATAAQARQQGGATVFPTTVEFEAPDELDIRPGMNADATIVTAERTGVLLIPERALTTVGDRVFVDVLVDGEAEEREIQLGYRSGGQVEVVEGLSEGDEVLLN